MAFQWWREKAASANLFLAVGRGSPANELNLGERQMDGSVLRRREEREVAGGVVGGVNMMLGACLPPPTCPQRGVVDQKLSDTVTAP